jgi:hypothetical protein
MRLPTSIVALLFDTLIASASHGLNHCLLACIWLRRNPAARLQAPCDPGRNPTAGFGLGPVRSRSATHPDQTGTRGLPPCASARVVRRAGASPRSRTTCPLASVRRTLRIVVTGTRPATSASIGGSGPRAAVRMVGTRTSRRPMVDASQGLPTRAVAARVSGPHRAKASPGRSGSDAGGLPFPREPSTGPAARLSPAITYLRLSMLVVGGGMVLVGIAGGLPLVLAMGIATVTLGPFLVSRDLGISLWAVRPPTEPSTTSRPSRRMRWRPPSPRFRAAHPRHRR